MNEQFASAMGRALDLTRAGSPMDATNLIQSALSGRSHGEVPRAPVNGARVRRSLKEVVDAIARTRHAMPARGPRQQVSPPVADGARYERRTHRCAYGERAFSLFVPSTRDTSPVGLVMMLHGCTQDADDFATGTRMNMVAEQHNLIVVYPDQARQANQMGCWNWFRLEDQGRGAGEPALLANLVGDLAQEFGIGEDRVFVAGLSAGGAMAAILGQAYPDVFAAVGVHSGLAAGAATDVPSAYAAMRGSGAEVRLGNVSPVRTIVFHGTADTTVAPANADAVIQGALGSGLCSEVEDPSETGATVTIYRDGVGATLAEKWSLGGVAHAWSGGAPEGSHTDPTGRDASSEMVRFFLACPSKVRS